MSLLKNTQDCCKGTTGTLHVEVVPSPSTTNNHKKHCSYLSQQYLPHLTCIESKLHQPGVHHGHALKSEAKVSNGLQTHLESGDLALRVRFSPSHPNEHAIVAQLTANDMSNLMAEGQICVQAPLNQGTFYVHSATPNYITGVEFVENRE